MGSLLKKKNQKLQNCINELKEEDIVGRVTISSDSADDVEKEKKEIKQAVKRQLKQQKVDRYNKRLQQQKQSDKQLLSKLTSCMVSDKKDGADPNRFPSKQFPYDSFHNRQKPINHPAISQLQNGVKSNLPKLTDTTSRSQIPTRQPLNQQYQNYNSNIPKITPVLRPSVPSHAGMQMQYGQTGTAASQLQSHVNMVARNAFNRSYQQQNMSQPHMTSSSIGSTTSAAHMQYENMRKRRAQEELQLQAKYLQQQRAS